MADLLVNIRLPGARESADAARNLRDRLADAATQGDRFNRDMSRRIGLIREENREVLRGRAATGGGSGSGGGVRSGGLARLAAASGAGGAFSAALGAPTAGLMAMTAGVAGVAGILRLFSTGLANAERNLTNLAAKTIALSQTMVDAGRAVGDRAAGTVRSQGQSLRRIALTGNQSLMDDTQRAPETIKPVAEALGKFTTEAVQTALRAAQNASGTGLVGFQPAFQAALESRNAGMTNEDSARLIRRTGQRNVTGADVASASVATMTPGVVQTLTAAMITLSSIDAQGVKDALGGQGNDSLHRQLYEAQDPLRAAIDKQVESMERNTASLQAAATAESKSMEIFRDAAATLANVLTLGVGEFNGSNRTQLGRERGFISEAARLAPAGQ